MRLCDNGAKNRSELLVQKCKITVDPLKPKPAAAFPCLFD